jgi:hypothetical protein
MDDASGALDSAASGYGPPSTPVVFRPAPGYRRPFLARFIQYVVVTAAFMIIGRVAVIGYYVGSIAAAVAVSHGISYLWRGRFATVVTPAGIEIRRYGNRVVPWSSVRAIEIGGYGAASVRLSQGYRRRGMKPPTPAWGRTSGAPAQLATVAVVRFDNKRIVLPAPLVTAWASDPTFTEKAKQLQHLCDQYAGPVELRSTLPRS